MSGVTSGHNLYDRCLWAESEKSMQTVFKLFLASFLGTLTLWYFLRSSKGQVVKVGTDPSSKGTEESEAILEVMSQKADALDEELRRELAIARLKSFLETVRKNRVPTH